MALPLDYHTPQPLQSGIRRDRISVLAMGVLSLLMFAAGVLVPYIFQMLDPANLERAGFASLPWLLLLLGLSGALGLFGFVSGLLVLRDGRHAWTIVATCMSGIPPLLILCLILWSFIK